MEIGLTFGLMVIADPTLLLVVDVALVLGQLLFLLEVATLVVALQPHDAEKCFGKWVTH